MMMAHDSGQPPSSRLDDESLDTLRRALRDYLHNSEHPSALQSSLLHVATEARARGIRPEQLLVALKETWNALPEVVAMHDSRERMRLLQDVVTMCIKEYYSA
jgi:hypothetical protein